MRVFFVPFVATDIRNAGIVQFLCDIDEFLFVDDLIEDSFDDFRFVFLDDISPVDDSIAVNHPSARKKTFASGIIVSSDDLLGEFLGIVFAVPFPNVLKDDSFGILADVLRRRNYHEPL